MPIGLGLAGGRMGLGLAQGYGTAALPWYRAGGAPLPVAAYQPKGAASLAASYVNLANPGTYDAAPGTAPSFATATGWTFDGATQWLSTGVSPGAGWSMLIRISGGTTTNYCCCCGVGYATNKMSIYPTYDGGGTPTHAYGNGSALATKAAKATSGVLAVAGQAAYLDGVDEGLTLTGPLGTVNNRAIGIGAENQSSPSAFWAGNVLAFALFSGTLNAGEVAALSTAMAAL